MSTVVADSAPSGTGQPSDNPQIEIPTGAVFVVQIEEQTPCKALRRVEDEVFVCRDQFAVSAGLYSEIVQGEEGVNRYIRSMLFAPSRQLKRGTRRSEVVSVGTESASAMKQTQRKSKQKERCENRLMSLLFATIYDPSTKRCRLVQDVPPLKLRRQDKNGKYRNVSNYTDVRLFLRNAMASFLAAHTSAMKVLGEMLPRVFFPMPTMFTIIGRTFMLILSCLGDSLGEDASLLARKRFATTVLSDCFDSIQEYITTWEKRNFTTDNRLNKCVNACKNDECYESVRAVLQSMIDVLPPSGMEPFALEFQQQELYGYGLRGGTSCDGTTQGENACLLGRNCPGSSSVRTSEGIFKASQAYMDALLNCAKLPPGVEGYNLFEVLEQVGFHSSAFRVASDNAILHRLRANYHWMTRTVFSDRHRESGEAARELRKYIIENFVQDVRFDVASCWAAFGRSNLKAAHIMNGVNVTDADTLRDTAVELIFGGGVAAMTIFERSELIIPITASLRGKAVHDLLMANEQPRVEQDGTDNDPATNNPERVADENSAVATPVEAAAPTTNVAQALDTEEVIEDGSPSPVPRDEEEYEQRTTKPGPITSDTARKKANQAKGVEADPCTDHENQGTGTRSPVRKGKKRPRRKQYKGSPGQPSKSNDSQQDDPTTPAKRVIRKTKRARTTRKRGT